MRRLAVSCRYVAKNLEAGKATSSASVVGGVRPGSTVAANVLRRSATTVASVETEVSDPPPGRSGQ